MQWLHSPWLSSPPPKAPTRRSIRSKTCSVRTSSPFSTRPWSAGRRGKKKPRTRQQFSPAKAGALSGSFWGLLFGLIFFVPLLGAAIGAAIGAAQGSLVDVGIDDKFIKKTREEVTEGTSAVFLLSANAVVDRVAEAFKALPPYELIASNLSAEQEAKLKEVFSA